MESEKIKDLFENEYFIHSDEAYKILKQLFCNNLYRFQVVKYNDWGPQFILIYQYLFINITFGSDRGDLIYSLKINGEEINLRNYDSKISNAMLLSEKNIFYVFQVMKRYLEDNNLLK